MQARRESKPTPINDPFKEMTMNTTCKKFLLRSLAVVTATSALIATANAECRIALQMAHAPIVSCTRSTVFNPEAGGSGAGLSTLRR
jgi:predicted transcriptional regulator